MADGPRDGADGERGPGLDTTLTDADIESNWDQVSYTGPALMNSPTRT
jgi:hypothetical protein